mmetsp:Transcript_73001/g.221008  ORF Transcript_73001/g.221008 Transcript_73001/m.221008 type:complete len:122 (-) Transcript_73001:187-552(-)
MALLHRNHPSSRGLVVPTSAAGHFHWPKPRGGRTTSALESIEERAHGTTGAAAVRKQVGRHCDQDRVGQAAPAAARAQTWLGQSHRQPTAPATPAGSWSRQVSSFVAATIERRLHGTRRAL